MESLHPRVPETSLVPATARSKRYFSLNISERKLLLGAIDIALLNGALFAALALRNETTFSLYGLWDVMLWSLILGVLWSMIAITLQIYTLSSAAQIGRSMGRASITALLTSALYQAVPFLTPAFPTSRREVLLFPVLCVSSVALWRAVYALFLVRDGLHHRAVLIGSSRSIQQLERVIEELSPADTFGQLFGYQFLGLVCEEAGATSNLTMLPRLGCIHDLRALLLEYRPHELVLSDEIVNALTNFEQSRNQPLRRRYDAVWIDLFDIILESRELGIAITTACTVYERLTGRVPVHQLGSSLEVAVPLNQSATYRLYLMVRRLLDIAMGLVGCLLLALAIPLVWLANRISSPGPLFYAQERVGEGGHLFRVLKFRSMVVDAEKFVGAVWAAENDPRITRVGQLLRKTRIDEMPQFWNILKGDMSLIGPRPERPQFVRQLANDIAFYRARHAVKPGLTGWAQVCYRYGASVEDSLIKLQYDLYYIKHVSLLMDLRIMLLTIPVVLGFKGR